jgi:hypothetical protein
MSQWSGNFAFQNKLGGTITSGTAKHWTTDWGTEEIDLAGLEDGDTSLSKSFTASSSNKDRWAFTATLADGTTYGVKEKDCGFEFEDAGKTVTLQAIYSNGDGTFVVAMPVSSSCDTSFS